MQTLNQIQSILENNKPALFRAYAIKEMAIFGSVARRESTENSDIDILVEFSANVGIQFIELADELERLLNSKVDLVSRRGIKEAYFQAIQNDLVYV